jgi:hypothetical protein
MLILKLFIKCLSIIFNNIVDYTRKLCVVKIRLIIVFEYRKVYTRGVYVICILLVGILYEVNLR